MKYFPIALVVLMLATARVECLHAAEPIVEAKYTPTVAAFMDSGRNKPIEIKTVKTAEKYFKGEELKKIKALKFEKIKLLVFAWRGSGQDKISYVVQESQPETVVFELQAGRTRDLRHHVKIYQLRSDVKWTTGAGVP